MISVPTPAARARAVTAAALAPSDLLTYQIHMERPRIGLTDARALAGESQSSAPSAATISSAARAAAAFAERPSRKLSPLQSRPPRRP